MVRYARVDHFGGWGRLPFAIMYCSGCYRLHVAVVACVIVVFSRHSTAKNIYHKILSSTFKQENLKKIFITIFYTK